MNNAGDIMEGYLIFCSIAGPVSAMWGEVHQDGNITLGLCTCFPALL